jgi:LacI family repressor for deo operon, udp, cdd, tsx, nupC, and nupG
MSADDREKMGVRSRRRIKTMEEFSAASGISRPTVSRYFNDPESVRPATRERIENALKELRYRPNLFAVNFNRRSPKTLGMIVPVLTDPFFAGLVELVEARALREGYWAIFLTSHGAIVAPLGVSSDLKLLRELKRSVPLVLLDSRVDMDASFVGTDNFQSVGLIVDYLLRTGEPPCFFESPSVNQNAVERRQAYVDAMKRHGAEPMSVRAPSEGWSFEAVGFEQAIRYFSLDALPRRTILCSTDRTAFGVLAAASQRGLRVSRSGDPGDIRVAGHDDHPLSRFASPPLTTVAQNSAEMANQAVDLLASGEVETRSVKEVKLLEAKLVMRDSA